MRASTRVEALKQLDPTLRRIRYSGPEVSKVLLSGGVSEQLDDRPLAGLTDRLSSEQRLSHPASNAILPMVRNQMLWSVV